MVRISTSLLIASRHYPTQRYRIIIWNLSSIFNEVLVDIQKFRKEYAYEDVVCKVAAILFGPLYVKIYYPARAWACFVSPFLPLCVYLLCKHIVVRSTICCPSWFNHMKNHLSHEDRNTWGIFSNHYVGVALVRVMGLSQRGDCKCPGHRQTSWRRNHVYNVIWIVALNTDAPLSYLKAYELE